MDKINNFHCICPSSTRGSFCEEVIDPCVEPVMINGTTVLRDSGVCGAHGTCESLDAGKYQCKCDKDYSGNHCHEKIDNCLNHTCKNGATCKDGIGTFTCLCADGWDGEFCTSNINECSSNPCWNNGSCLDLVNGYVCNCPAPWKGKLCRSESSHCNGNPCRNGGICTDTGDGFECNCQSGFTGRICQIAPKPCSSNPCKNNGTCVNSGDGASFSCMCSDAWEGSLCEKNVNDCASNPCHNGGTCIDGVGWVLCSCAAGFTGPVCKININECNSSPCSDGATCKDKINGFECICPPEKFGTRCQGDKNDRVHCALSDGTIQPHNTTWNEDCNDCSCSNGRRKCTEVDCGAKNCWNDTQAGACPSGEVCVPKRNVGCLKPPCEKWAECSGDPATSSLQIDSEISDGACFPNSTNLNGDCAKVHVVFNTDKLPLGTLVEELCHQLRNLPILRKSAENARIRLMCEGREKNGKTITVVISVASTPRTEMAEKAALNIARYIRDAPSMEGKEVNVKLYKVLIAVKEVTVETSVTLTYHEEDAAPDYLIPLIASLVVLAAILLLILCIRGKWREQRLANREMRSVTRTTLKKKRNTTQEKPVTNTRTYYNQTSTDSTASSSSTSSSTRSTELRNFEYNRTSLLESSPSVCSTPPQLISPPLSPKEEGAKDEWRRFRVQRNSTQIEIIV